MKNILIVGCGGIGSYFIRELHQLYNNSVQGTEEIAITMVDGDEVEEKNLRYQNFEIENLGLNKAEALQQKYPFEIKKDFIKDDSELDDYDVFIIAVDNGKLRDLVYRHCDMDKDKYFIDLRAEGKGIVVFTTNEKNDLKTLQSTIDVDKPSTSCQLKYELDEGIIQVGNRIVAMIGIQFLLNYLRDESNPAKIIQRF